MGFSNNLNGAVLTVAVPLGLLGAIVLWGFFDRRPGRSFGGISKASDAETVGRPQVEARDPGVQGGGSSREGPLG